MFPEHFGESHRTNQVSIQLQFFYDDKLASLSVENVKLSNASIEKVLDAVLKGKNNRFQD